MNVYMCGCMYYSTLVEVRGQLSGVGPLLYFDRFWELNSGHQAHRVGASTCRVILPVRKCNQPRCLSMNKWTVKLWYIRIREFYLAMKKNEIIKFVGKGKELEIIFREVTQDSPKQILYILFHMWLLDSVKYVRPGRSKYGERPGN